MYEVLHYRRDVTDSLKPGTLMGPDFGTRRIFEVIDAEYDPVENRTTVNLQTPPSLDALRAAGLID